MKKHKDALSNTSLNAFGGKYNKVKRTKSVPDITKSYDIRPDGWRRKC